MDGYNKALLKEEPRMARGRNEMDAAVVDYDLVREVKRTDQSQAVEMFETDEVNQGDEI